MKLPSTKILQLYTNISLVKLVTPPIHIYLASPVIEVVLKIVDTLHCGQALTKLHKESDSFQRFGTCVATGTKTDLIYFICFVNDN